MFEWAKKLINKFKSNNKLIEKTEVNIPKTYFCDNIFNFVGNAEKIKEYIDDEGIKTVCEYIENTQQIYIKDLNGKVNVYLANKSTFVKQLPEVSGDFTEEQLISLKKMANLSNSLPFPLKIVFYSSGNKYIFINEQEFNNRKNSSQMSLINDHMLIETTKTFQFIVRGGRYISRHNWLVEGQARLITAKALNNGNMYYTYHFNTDILNPNGPKFVPIFNKRELTSYNNMKKAMDKLYPELVYEHCVYFVSKLSNWEIIDFITPENDSKK